MPSPAFIVEGHLEQEFLRNTCPGAPIRKIGCNGDHVDLDVLAKFIGTQARLLQRRYRPLIVIFDREKREMSCEEIETQVREYLDNENINVELVIGIPDREIENWILADVEVFCDCTSTNPRRLKPSYEGKQGKSVIKTLLAKRRSYVETSDGPSWLKKCRPAEMANASQSFGRFFESIKGINCWWLGAREEQLPLV